MGDETNPRWMQENPDPLVVITPTGHILDWNLAAESVFGYSRAEAIGEPIAELIVPTASRDEDARFLAEILQHGQGTFDGTRCCKNGALIYVDISGKALRNDAGAVECVILAKKDVTAFKVQRDIKLMEARFRDLLESMPDGIVMANPAGYIVIANSQAERLFGYARTDMLGERIEMLLPERFRGSHVGHRSHYFAQPAQAFDGRRPRTIRFAQGWFRVSRRNQPEPPVDRRNPVSDERNSRHQRPPAGGAQVQGPA